MQGRLLSMQSRLLSMEGPSALNAGRRLLNAWPSAQCMAVCAVQGRLLVDFEQYARTPYCILPPLLRNTP